MSSAAPNRSPAFGVSSRSVREIERPSEPVSSPSASPYAIVTVPASSTLPVPGFTSSPGEPIGTSLCPSLFTSKKTATGGVGRDRGRRDADENGRPDEGGGGQRRPGKDASACREGTYTGRVSRTPPEQLWPFGQGAFTRVPQCSRISVLPGTVGPERGSERSDDAWQTPRQRETPALELEAPDVRVHLDLPRRVDAARGHRRDRRPSRTRRLVPARDHEPRDARPRLRQHRRVRLGDHLHRRGRGDPALPGLPDRAAGREGHVPRGVLPADLRRAPVRTRSSTPSPTRSAGTPSCTRTCAGSSTGFPATRTRWPCCRRPCPPCPPSTRTASTRSTVSTSRSRPYGCSPRCPRSRPTPSRSPSVSRSSTPTTPWATSRTSCG